MAKDIEEFLKMAAARRKQALNQQQPAAQPPLQKRPVAPKPPARRMPEPEIEIIDDGDIIDLGRQSVTQHVRSHIQTGGIAEHAEQLGSRVSATEDAVESRISKKFDHEVGHLNLTPMEGVASEVTRSSVDDVSLIASDLVQILNSPQGIRNAIILNEVLRRPDFD